MVSLGLAALGYWVGFVHGHDRAKFEAPREVVYQDYPFAGVCGEMLEAAWSIQTPPPSQGSPHKP